MCPLYYVDSKVINRFKYSSIQWCVTRRERVNNNIYKVIKTDADNMFLNDLPVWERCKTVKYSPKYRCIVDDDNNPRKLYYPLPRMCTYVISLRNKRRLIHANNDTVSVDKCRHSRYLIPSQWRMENIDPKLNYYRRAFDLYLHLGHSISQQQDYSNLSSLSLSLSLSLSSSVSTTGYKRNWHGI